MKKTKKMMAFALAASMMLGSSAVTFAADTTGSTTGTGTSEGHVEQKATNVILPTVTAGSSLFAYTMDPERLIQGTDAAKYEEGSVFPEEANDTGVYFLTGDKTYANTSNSYKVINKSSCDVAVTVKVKAVPNTDATKDIGLGEEADIATATAPKLYLGLKVGNGTTTVTTSEQTITKTISGTPGNFKIGVRTNENDEKVYEYQTKPDASTWKAMNLNMTGKVTTGKSIASDTTAPAVEVTWSWAEKGDGDPAAVEADMVDYVDGPQMTVSQTGLITITGLTSEKNYQALKIQNKNGGPYHVNDAPCTWNEDNFSTETGGSLTCQLGDVWIDSLRGITTGKAILELKDGSTVEANITIPE